MCLLLVSLNQHPQFKWIAISNRDEYFDRPAAGIHRWPNASGIIAGKDLKGQGTWLGVHEQGRFASVTNHRAASLALKNEKQTKQSRGLIVKTFLETHQTPVKFSEDLEFKKNLYNPYSLIAGNQDHFFYYSNVSNQRMTLAPGTYGLSNHFLDTPWPKLNLAKKRFQQALALQDPSEMVEAFFSLLEDPTQAAPQELPRTGLTPAEEKRLSSIFILGPNYGTRCSTVLFMNYNGNGTLIEQTFGPMGVKKSRLEIAFGRL